MAFAGISVIADGELSPYTKSPVDTGATNSGYHLLLVQGYTRAATKEENTSSWSGGFPWRIDSYIQSRPFVVGGHRWALIYYPNNVDEGTISIFLTSDDEEEELGDDDDLPVVRARFRFSFIDQPELRAPFTRRCRIYDFIVDSINLEYHGEYRFMRRDVLERSRHLKDDSFVIRCDVLVVDDDEDYDTAEEDDTQEVQLPDMLQSHLRNLLTKEGTDVTFEVGSKKFAAHRCVLAARSTVFKLKLSGTKDAVLKIDDIEPKVFRALLTFIYTDTLSGMEDEEEDEWLRLLEAADIYDLHKLRLICEEMLAGRICLWNG